MDFKKFIGFKKPRETIINLKKCLNNKLREEHFYKQAADRAKDEGFSNVAEFFRNLVKEEKENAKKIEAFLHKIRD